MCIEQATFAHGVIHLFEAGHGNSETQQIGFKVGTHGRIEEAEETALTIFWFSRTVRVTTELQPEPKGVATVSNAFVS